MNSYQITLFLEEDTIYKISKVSSEISSGIEEIGEPILMPDNMSAPREANIPLIVFNKNSNIQIIMSFRTIVISIIEEDTQKLLKELNCIMNILENNNIYSNRLGYVKSIFMNNEKINEFKNNTFSNQENIDCKDFEFSCLYDIKINNIYVNCWERYYTNIEINDKLNIIFDINTKAFENHKINIDFLNNFIKESNVYIENKIFK